MKKDNPYEMDLMDAITNILQDEFDPDDIKGVTYPQIEEFREKEFININHGLARQAFRDVKSMHVHQGRSSMKSTKEILSGEKTVRECLMEIEDLVRDPHTGRRVTRKKLAKIRKDQSKMWKISQELSSKVPGRYE
jgi:hypothetical protein